jgi:hypothetical protein
MTSCRLYGSIGAVEGAMLFTGAVRVNLSAGTHKLSAAAQGGGIQIADAVRVCVQRAKQGK